MNALWLALMLFAAREPAKVVPEHVEGPWRVDVSRAAGLDYIVLEPREVRPGTPLRTIVYLHGRSARARVPDPRVYALSTPVRILVPRAPEPSGAGFAWMPVSASRGESDALVRALDDRTARLGAAIDVWSARHPMRGRPLVVGFSQGGMLAIGLALRSRRVSGAIAMSAWYPPSRAIRSRVPVTMLHGARDPILDVERSRTTADALGARFEVFDAGHEVPPAMAVRLRALLHESI